MANIEVPQRRSLVVNAHPDDIILEAALTARSSKLHRVDEVLLTHTSDERLEEEFEVMNVLGVEELYMLGDENGWEDGSLATHTRGLLVASLVGIMDQAADEGQPFTDIITMHGSVTGHPDHDAVSKAARAAFHKHPHAQRYHGVVFTRPELQIFDSQYEGGYTYRPPTPPRPRRGKYEAIFLSPDEYQLKQKAADVYHTQRPDADRHIERFQQLAERGGVVELYRYIAK